MVESKTRKELGEETQAFWRAQEQLMKTRERAEYILATSPATTYTCEVGDKWAATFVSENVKSQFGYEPNEFLEDHNFWVEHIHPDDRERVLAGVSCLFEDDSHVLEYRFLHKDGSYRWVHDESRLIRDEQGKLLERIGCWVDITEHKRTEELLRKGEERFRLAMEITNDALWDWNIVTNEVYRNARHATMLGYERHELSASPDAWENLIHPGDKQLIRELIDEHLSGKRSSFEVEYRLRAKSGDYIWVLGRGEVTAYCDDGLPARMIGTNIDITARKRVEVEIRNFRRMTDLAPYGCTMSDLDGNLTYVNDKFASMHGYASVEVIGKNSAIFHTDAQLKLVNKYREQLIETGRGIRGEEIWHVHRDGMEFPTLMNTWIMRDDDGNPFLLCATAVDITELKLMQQREREHREEIAHFARLSTIGEMSSALAHELNQPLCAVATHAEGALRMMRSGDWGSEKLLQAVEGAGTQAVRAGKIIRRMANLVRKRRAHHSSVHIEEIIRETINLLEYEARLKEMTIVWVEPAEKAPMLRVDRIQIQQVLVNLIHNSFEAMKDLDPSKRQTSIEVSTDENDLVQVGVSDTGCGLSAENTDMIFEPLFTTKSQGLGMGLSISCSIIEAHGGRIWAESNAACGATFRFTLPAIGGVS